MHGWTPAIGPAGRGGLSRRALAAAGLAGLLAAHLLAPLPAAAGGCGACDDDGDGLTNAQEQQAYGTDLANPDTDGDGLSDGGEIFLYATNPFVADTDGDGVNDVQEVAYGTDPLQVNHVIVDPSDPGNGDSDGDGLWNAEELGVYFTGVYNWDTDGDGWGDGAEVNDGSDPLDPACDPTGCG